MKAGDLVKADPWVNEGAIGIVLSVQDRDALSSAYVLIGDVVELIRLDNLKVINESR
jgi:hypothetical protein|tara:strand:- start:58 stop:228 length:171 start_codon:yes stop_codon:yes gene_type:complete